MNTLARLDTYVASFLVPSVNSSASVTTPVASPVDVPARPTTSRLSSLPPTPRKPRRRRPKPTTSSVKVPPPTTPLLLRIVLGLWSILLSLWTSLVVETRAERVKRRRRSPNLLRQLRGHLPDLGSEAEGEGSASEIEGGIVSDDDWVDPVTRAPVDEKVDEPDEEEFAAPPSDEKFTFRLRSAEKNGLPSPPATPPPIPRTSIQQPTPPGILSNPMPPRPRKTGLLPNPIVTAVLDPTVPAVPSSKTFTMSTAVPAPRKHTTPFHLQKTLILDLDETLIHSTSRPISYAASGGGGMLGLSGGLLGGRGKRREGHTVEVVLNGRSTTYHVYKRPHVDHFLKKASWVASWYTLVIFTASMPEYADPVIDWLDAGRGLFAKKLYRESCHLQPNGSYIKDLALVEADLSRVCFMDNSPISYSWNKANALPIEGWTSDPNDEALLHSIPVLDSLRFVNDVRRVLGIRGFT